MRSGRKLTEAEDAELRRLGREGMAWMKLAGHFHIRRTRIYAEWNRVASADDMRERDAVIANAPWRLKSWPERNKNYSRHLPYQSGDNYQPAVPRPRCAEIFAGQRFADDPRAIADCGSARLPPRPEATLQNGSSLGWVMMP